MDTDQQSPSKPTVLATLQLSTLFDIHLVGDKWVGPWHSLIWGPMRSIAVALRETFSEVSKRPPSEFGVEEFVASVGDNASVGIHIVHTAAARMDDEATVKCDRAAREFMHVIVPNGSAGSQPLDSDRNPDIRAIAARAGHDCLARCGRPRVPIPINAIIGAGKVRVQIRRLIRLTRLITREWIAACGRTPMLPRRVKWGVSELPLQGGYIVYTCLDAIRKTDGYPI